MKRVLHKTSILVLLACISISFSYAQEGKIRRATKKYDGYSYVDARTLYHRIVAGGYGSSEVYANLGDSYYFTAEYGEAVKWYDKLVADGGEIDPEYYFRYALALKSTRDYARSDEMMDAFEKANTDDTRGKMFAKERDYIGIIERQSGRYQANRLKINSELQDFGPTFYGDRLVFSSNRSDDSGIGKHEWNDQPYLDLYIVDDLDDPNPQPLKGDVNTIYHESTSVFNVNGDVMYFTRNNFTKRKLRRDENGTNKLKLYRSQLKDGEWQTAEELPFNSDEYSVAHPALSPDGQTLYFASDMPGTLGLSDLWKVSINPDGTYGEPQNLGPSVNTEGRDTFPFISSKGKLFFATDGHIGLGGLDVFVAQLDEQGIPGETFNVGKPVNSAVDDFSLILDEEGGKGYFASNRATGEGNDDIYGFIRTKEIISECGQTIAGVTRDAKTNEVLPSAKVQLRDAQNQVITQTISDVRGNFRFEDITCGTLFLVRGEKEEYDPSEVTLTTGEDLGGEVKRDLYLNPPLIINKGDDLAKTLNLNPIYFDLDKSNIRWDAAKELVKVVSVMEQFPNLKIDVRSHTDSRANDAYNMALSQRRNDSTIQFIIDQGISPGRLTGRGYGETQLTNPCANGVDCSEIQHQLNRRSEFIVVEN